MSSHVDEARAETLPTQFREKQTISEVLTSEKYFKWLLLIPLMVILAVFAFYPLFYCLYMSFHKAILVQPPEFLGLENYRKILRDPFFWTVIGRSASAVVVCVGIEVILGLGIAVYLNREFRGQNTVRGLCLLPLVVSPLAMSLMWKYFLEPQFGIINAMVAGLGFSQVPFLSTEGLALGTIMFMESWKWLPFSIFVFLAALRGMPKDVFEAASVDGASGWYTFRRLTLPLLRPFIMIVVLLRVMWLIRLSDPLFGTTQGGAGTEVLDWFVYRIAFVRFDLGEGTTLALIALIMTLIIGALLFRQLIKALEGSR
jgi:multiple sugar transport system permease protein